MQRSTAHIPSNQGEEARKQEMALVERCRRGDIDAFRDLYERHSARLYNLSYRMSGNEADAEDLLQEVFLQAYRKLGSFRGESSLGTWLYRLATNLCLDRLRSRQGRSEQRTDRLERADGRPSVEPAAPRAEAVIDRIDLERAIARLPDSYRAAFLLHDVEGFDHREVGEIMDIAEGTSKSLVHKARLKLRAILS
ncbi:MAG: RNA polymerase sigma factor [Vicinamibacterales bacterium]